MDADDAVSRTREALRSSPENGALWRALGMAHELRQEFDQATLAYERALQLMPEDTAIAGDLGRLAHRLGMLPQAVQLLSAHLQARPDDRDAINTLACVLRDQHDYGAAIALLQDAITKAPDAAALWNTLGTVLSARGDGETARTFFLEALRLDPRHPGVRYNLACAELDLGEVDAALADCEQALAETAEPHERATIGFARATMLLCAGRLGEGWDAYEARFDPNLPDSPVFEIELPRLPEGPTSGRVLVVGEQGVGDEILFASLLPDLAVEGVEVAVAVDPRLVGLFARSFPGVSMVPHATQRDKGRRRRWVPDPPAADAWTPMASLARRYRRALDAFPDRRGYLHPAPECIAYWQGWLSAHRGLKIGLLWKGSSAAGARTLQYCPFAELEPVLKTPGVTFVNLQYGDSATEQAEAQAMGVSMLQPPGLDLRNDLDDLAALCAALDVVIGPANATTNLAGACGAEAWFLTAPAPWTHLGGPSPPWYSQARAFTARRHGEWAQAVGELAVALLERR